MTGIKHLSGLCLLLLLASCGDLPRPFAGKPGALAMHLATPPVARLVVIMPGRGSINPDAAKIWADDVAQALVAGEMPAEVGNPGAIDWSVGLGISKAGDLIVPLYELHDGTGKLRGTVDGTPIPGALWNQGDKDLLRQSAQQAAPKIGDLLTNIEAVRMQADPGSLLHRAARVVLLPGQGASGDGNQSLTAQMAIYLKTHGIIVIADPDQADYKLQVDVAINTASPTEQQVQVIWIVTDARGHEAGRIAQLNDVPVHSLDGHWGEVATMVAEQAAGGVAEVISNQLPTHKNKSGA